MPTFNETRLRGLRDKLKDVLDKGGEDAFDMTLWVSRDECYYTRVEDGVFALAPRPEKGYACGTTACLAGWTVFLYPEEARRIRREEGVGTILSVATYVLGLGDGDGGHLFFGEWRYGSLEDVTLEDAIAYLDRCLEAGRIVR